MNYHGLGSVARAFKSRALGVISNVLGLPSLFAEESHPVCLGDPFQEKESCQSAFTTAPAFVWETSSSVSIQKKKKKSPHFALKWMFHWPISSDTEAAHLSASRSHGYRVCLARLQKETELEQKTRCGVYNNEARGDGSEMPMTG